MTTYLLDTNVWLRAVQPAAPQHAAAVNALATILARGDEIVITAQNLIEFWSVATRPVEATVSAGRLLQHSSRLSGCGACFRCSKTRRRS